MTLNVNNSSVSELFWLQREAATQTTGTADSDNDAVVLTSGEDSGTPSLEDIESEYLAAEAEYTSSTDSTGETDSADEVETATAANSASSTSSVVSSTSTGSTTGATSEEIQAEIDKLEDEKEENVKKMEEIEANIEKLADSAEEHIIEAAKAQEDAVSEQEDETQKVLDENLQAYINANKEGGEGMTRDELSENIKSALPDTPEIADAVAALTAASEEVDEIDANLSELNSLITDTQSIEEEIEAKQEEYDLAVEAEEAEAAASCCDPIGFTVGEGEEQAQYDFIIDDGSFDSTSDFLGADGNWSAMTELDTDGDNIVTAEELQAGNIKAVKTNADGSQEIVDLVEEFGEDFSINLSSYQEGGSYSGIDTTTDSDGDGTSDQSLLGTFDVNIGGETVSGYNTLDDTDWLSENYGLSSDTTNVENSEDIQTVEYSEDLQSHVNFFNEYTEISEELRSEIEAGYEDLGISEEQMKALNETTQKEADENAKNFFASLGLNEDDISTEDTSTDSAASIEEEEEELLDASVA